MRAWTTSRSASDAIEIPRCGTGIEAWDQRLGAGVSVWVNMPWTLIVTLHYWIRWHNVNNGRKGVIDRWAWPGRSSWGTAAHVLTGPGLVEFKFDAKGWVVKWGIPQPTWSGQPWDMVVVTDRR